MRANLDQLDAFLADLTTVHSSLQTGVYSSEFVLDLTEVHSLLPAPPTLGLTFLNDLAEKLDGWNGWAKEQVVFRKKGLSQDDPLICPISLFRTMDYGRLETAHTRTLAWLLNPKGEHGFGGTLLSALLQRLTGQQRIHRLRGEVKSEHPTTGVQGEGRLDVFGSGLWEEDGITVEWALVIEAKVGASEGEMQLAKYDDWLNFQHGKRKMYRVFLTPHGRAPEGGIAAWEAMSFPSLVKTFRSVYQGLRDRPGFHFLRFYLAGVLQDICGCPQGILESADDPYAVFDYLK